MNKRIIKDGISWLGAIDWERRLFDALIPLPDGTSYNAYLVEGTEKIALLDTVEPMKKDVLLAQLQDVPKSTTSSFITSSKTTAEPSPMSWRCTPMPSS